MTADPNAWGGGRRRGLLSAATVTVLVLTLTGVAAARLAEQRHPPGALVALVDASAPRDDLYNGQFCAGALVADDAVVTARHCLAEKNIRRVEVVVGARDLCRGNVGDVQRRGVVGAALPAEATVDLAVLLLASPVRGVQPVATVRERVADSAVAWGWGRASQGGVPPCEATAVRLRPLSPECNRVVEERYSATVARGTYLCGVAAPGEPRGTCTGDSGGPVLTESRPSRLLAVVAFGAGCAADDTGAYTSTAALDSWRTWPMAADHAAKAR